MGPTLVLLILSSSRFLADGTKYVHYKVKSSQEKVGAVMDLQLWTCSGSEVDNTFILEREQHVFFFIWSPKQIACIDFCSL